MEALEMLRADIRQVEASLSADIHRLRAEMHELNGDTKRHMDVVAESLRDDIRIIAEGVVALSAKVDSLRR
jgi:phage host-nuclease inhibitor protein Gam